MTIMVEPKRCTSFDEAWTEADRIQGWLTEFEARMLFEFACQVPDDQVIVEVGSFQGKSTVVLAHSGRRVLAVDPMFTTSTSPMKIGPYIQVVDIVLLKKHFARHKNVTWVRSRADECVLPEEPIGLLYIDGEHAYPYPRRDFQHFRSKVAEQGVVAFHDLDLPDVEWSVDELLQTGVIEKVDRVDSLLVCRVRVP